LNGRSNTGARSQMSNHINLLAVEHSSYRLAVAKIDVTQSHVLDETGNVGLLYPRIVKIIEIIENDDFMSGDEQLLNKMRADETGAARDENSHGAKLATDGK
jgi:hypothetical protein